MGFYPQTPKGALKASVIFKVNHKKEAF